LEEHSEGIVGSGGGEMEAEWRRQRRERKREGGGGGIGGKGNQCLSLVPSVNYSSPLCCVAS
jgi:hypothetical protein